MEMQKYLLAHDLGTSGNKATLFTIDGQLIKSSVSGYKTHYFQDNWAEQNPEDWWDAICASTRMLIDGIDSSEIAAVSFSGQMMGCLPVDRNGKPLHDSIIWADMRAQDEEREINAAIGSRNFFEATGHRAGASYTLAKVLWLRKNKPEVIKNTYKLLQAKDYAVYKLTGKYLTDYSDAAGTNAFDINSFDWSDTILDALDLSRDLFPDVVESTRIAGEITKEAAAECGLKKGTPVIVGAGDGGAGPLGAGCVSSESTYCCMGTSAWIGHISDHLILDKDMKLVNWPHAIPGLISTNGTMQCAGTSYTWMLDNLCGLERYLAAQEPDGNVYAYIDKVIESAAPGCNGLYYVPYLCGERCPRWDGYAKGGFYGLKMEHTHSDMVRSVIEGIAYNMRLILDIYKDYSNISQMAIIGGLVKSKSNLKILADIMNVRLNTMNYRDEATSVGAAVLAGVGSGVIKDFGEVDKFTWKNDTQEPDQSNRLLYDKMKDTFDSTYYAMHDIYYKMSMQQEA